MRLIDADKLYPDCTTKNGTLAISQSQIAKAPTVPTHSQKLGCEICANRNIKSKEACTSPFGVCEFFDDTPDRSFEIAQKSIELGRSLGRTEERAESKTSQGKLIKIFENPFTNGYICPFCGHEIHVTEQFLPKVTECEVCGAELKGGSET